MFCTDENTQRVPISMNVEFEQHKKKKHKKTERNNHKIEYINYKNIKLVHKLKHTRH
jgi:ribosomal protein S18